MYIDLLVVPCMILKIMLGRRLSDILSDFNYLKSWVWPWRSCLGEDYVYTWTSLLFLQPDDVTIMQCHYGCCTYNVLTISYLYGCESTSLTNVSGWQTAHPESMLQGPADTNSTAIHYYNSGSRRWTLTQEETTTTVKRHCCLQTFTLMNFRLGYQKTLVEMC